MPALPQAPLVPPHSPLAAIVGDSKLVLGVDPSPGMKANAEVPAGVRLAAGAARSVYLLENTAPRGGVQRALLKVYVRGVVPGLARWVARHRNKPH